MVTTRQQLIEFIVGNMTTVIPPHTLTVPEWERIILAAADELTLEYLRGFKSVPQILELGHNFYTKPSRPPTNVEILFTIQHLRECSISESDVWLPCVALEMLPDLETWPKKGEGYDVETKSMLLMKRHKKGSRRHAFEFFVLSIDVQLMKTQNRTAFDKEYWLKLVDAELTSVALGGVLESLDQDKLLSSACRILLQQLVRFQTETFEDLNDRCDQAKRAKDRLNARARLVGIA